MGKMNRLLAMEYGISKEIAKAFVDGFPSNWQDLIHGYFHQLETSITVTQECLSPKKFLQLKIKQKTARNKTRIRIADLNTSLPTILTPTGLLKLEMTRSELPTTRSGRISLPPLAGWAGQHYKRQGDTGLVHIAFNTDCARRVHGEETLEALSLSKTKKQYLCGSTLSKDLINSPVFNTAVMEVKKSTPPAFSASGSQKTTNTHRKSPGHISVKAVSAIDENGMSLDMLDRSLQPEVLLKDCSLRPEQPTKGAKREEQPPNEQKIKDSENDKTDAPAAVENKESNKRGRPPKNPKPCPVQPASWTSDESKKRGRPSKNPKPCPVQLAGWTSDEECKFHTALAEVDGDCPNYWNAVSQLVGSKSAEECQQFHRDFLSQKPQVEAKAKPNKSKGKNGGRQKGDPIRGGKGTLKRKQEVREFLNEQNEGYEDDLFEGTPFVKLKCNPVMKSFGTIDFNKSDSDIFGKNHNFFTPVAGRNPFDTPGMRVQAKLASVRKTPANQGVLGSTLKATPMSVNNRKHDVIIKNILDKKKQQKSSSSKEVTGPSNDELETSQLPIKALFPERLPEITLDSLAGQIEDSENDDGDDDENENQFLYYWSDGD